MSNLPTCKHTTSTQQESFFQGKWDDQKRHEQDPITTSSRLSAGRDEETLDDQTGETMSSHDHLTTIGRRQTTAGNVWCTQTVVHPVLQWSLILKTPSDNSRLWAYIGHVEECPASEAQNGAAGERLAMIKRPRSNNNADCRVQHTLKMSVGDVLGRASLYRVAVVNTRRSQSVYTRDADSVSRNRRIRRIWQSQ